MTYGNVQFIFNIKDGLILNDLPIVQINSTG